MGLTAVLLAVVTAVLGLVAGWALGRSRSAAVVGERDTLRAERDDLRASYDDAQRDLADARTAVAVAGERLEAERAAMTQRIADLQQSEAQLKESFQALSHQALEANSKQFLEVAQATLRAAQTESQADLDQRRQAVE
ncbi:MAG TPA: hypothetical protein VNA12_02480, partial [Mycobacteriales bacterium]|nr:hypothetical protein [Mycobacteriales bacterium]